MKNTFQPISELALVSSHEKIMIGAGEKKFLSYGIEAGVGEQKELALHYVLEEGAELEVAVFVRGGGEISVTRTANVLGKGAKLSFVSSGIIEKTGRIFATDDVQIHAQGAHVRVRTNLVLKDDGESCVRSRVVLGASAAGSDAHARIDQLVLSGHAKAFGIPELDVQTADVTCGHGATVSPLSPESIRYLMSRGLSYDGAADILVHGFLMA